MTVCLNCDGWGCEACALERAEAAGGEQGPTALELQVQHLRQQLESERTLRDIAEKKRDVAVAERNVVAAERNVAWVELAQMKTRLRVLLSMLEGGAA